MGYMRHHAIIVSSWDAARLSEAHSYAALVFPSISSITAQSVNGYSAFLVPPDGSKEGWSDSDLGDARRLAFIKWMRSRSYEDGSTALAWVEVQFNDDDGVEKITSSSADREANKQALLASPISGAA